MKLTVAFAILAHAVALATAFGESEKFEAGDEIGMRIEQRQGGKDFTAAPGGINSRITKRSSCDFAGFIDVFFDVGLDGDRFARCTDVPINNWSASSTPGDFAWCRKELTRCSQANAANYSGVCVRGSDFCAAAQNYCTTLKGQFSCH